MREFNRVEPIGSLYEKNYKKAKGVEHPIGCSTPRKKLVEIFSYCLLNNHYHFIIGSDNEHKISEFFKKLNGGYTNYFNKKYKRSGSLFQGRFKKYEIKKYSQLLKLIVYVNCNSEVHKFSPKEKWPWSSYLDLADLRDGTLCNKFLIKEEFKSVKDFQDFCIQTLPDIIEDKELKEMRLE